MSTIALSPLWFEPFLRPMPWGGQQLADWVAGDFRPEVQIGEAWLLSDHPAHPSRVAGGAQAGWTLRQLMASRPEEMLGFPAQRFPLLVKLLDARANLSVQVHPDDRLAQRWAPGEGGKTEAWLILDASPSAVIHLGLKPGIDRGTVERELALGTLPLCLRQYRPQPGQCYFVPAGVIHALGGGIVALEVQQTSDATFRLYDWGRLDARGQPRPLHLEAGLACLKESTPGAGLQSPRRLTTTEECLVSCAFFAIHRHELVQRTPFRGPCILVGLAGQAELLDASSPVTLRRGQAVLIPSAIGSCVCEPREPCLLVEIRVPGPGRGSQ
jgi:mannose-6-phosphate isomerase